MDDQIIKKKYFVFSDESGSWHDSNCVYVRSWIVIGESSYSKLIDKINYINTSIGCNELKWKTLAHNPSFFNFVDEFDFRIFITISSPSDINWEQKYKVTRSFSTQVENFDFGEIDSVLMESLKKKMFDDIKNVLFLNFYEKTHIQNAKDAIDSVLPKKDNLLIYRVDPPQMSENGWRDILKAISPGVQIEFPRSHSDEGIQFADTVAGCVRSFIEKDGDINESIEFIKKIKSKLIQKSSINPNPNLIFFKEIKDSIKQRSGEIWTL